jgi:hypothetical protein
MSEPSEGDESGGRGTAVVRRANGTHVPLPLHLRPKRYSRWRWLWVLVPILLVYPIFLAGRALLGVRTIAVEAPPLPLEADDALDEAWAEVLAVVLSGSHIDYSGLAREREALERYVATLAEVGPRTAPDRFPTEGDRLAYYLDAYNALVMLGVVAHWPIQTVHDVRGPFEPKPGFGFFLALRFPLDGGWTNLSDLEDDSLRRRGDARIHAAIHSGALSSPALSPLPYRPETLEDQLDRAARHFASEPPHVVIDDAAGQIRLSALYDWYGEDFRRHAAGMGLGATVLDWIERFAEPQVQEALARARAAGYAVVFAPWDWSLNGD